MCDKLKKREGYILHFETIVLVEKAFGVASRFGSGWTRALELVLRAKKRVPLRLRAGKIVVRLLLNNPVPHVACCVIPLSKNPLY